MRIMISILLCSIVFLTSVKELTHTLVFTINRETITELHCINKAQPLLMCYGSCHFQKVIEEHRDNQNHQPSLTEPFKDIVLYYYNHDLLTQDMIPANKKAVLLGRYAYLGSPFYEDIFRPPIV